MKDLASLDPKGCRRSSDLIPKYSHLQHSAGKGRDRALRLFCPIQEVKAGPGVGRMALPSLIQARGPGQARGRAQQVPESTQGLEQPQGWGPAVGSAPPQGRSRCTARRAAPSWHWQEEHKGEHPLAGECHAGIQTVRAPSGKGACPLSQVEQDTGAGWACFIT